MSEVIGYAQTSTVEQAAGLGDQKAELQRAGETSLYSEQVSGADAARPQLQESLRFVRRGDTYVLTKRNRLARPTVDLLSILQGSPSGA